jgi:hypothetical protein
MPSQEALSAVKEIDGFHPDTPFESLTVGAHRKAEIIDRHFLRVRNAYALAASIDRDFTTLAGRMDQLCCDLNPNKSQD